MGTPRITILEVDPVDPPGRLADWLQEAGASVNVVAVHAAEVPGIADVGDALVVMGGRANALDDAVPWMRGVKDLVADALAADLPTLGVCLGHQILADVLGGTVVVGDAAGGEHGPTPVTWGDAGASDPMTAAMAQIEAAQPMSHYDVVATLPPGAVELARTASYPNTVFRVEAAVGVQFHPEADADLMERWEAERDGGDPAAMRLKAEDADPAVVQAGRALARGLVDAVQSPLRRVSARPSGAL